MIKFDELGVHVSNGTVTVETQRQITDDGKEWAYASFREYELSYEQLIDVLLELKAKEVNLILPNVDMHNGEKPLFILLDIIQLGFTNIRIDDGRLADDYWLDPLLPEPCGLMITGCCICKHENEKSRKNVPAVLSGDLSFEQWLGEAFPTTCPCCREGIGAPPCCCEQITKKRQVITRNHLNKI